MKCPLSMRSDRERITYGMRINAALSWMLYYGICILLCSMSLCDTLEYCADIYSICMIVRHFIWHSLGVMNRAEWLKCTEPGLLGLLKNTKGIS